MNLWVVGVQVIMVSMEAVAILHGELAYPNQAPSGARLVAEFGLYLVDHEG